MGLLSVRRKGGPPRSDIWTLLSSRQPPCSAEICGHHLGDCAQPVSRFQVMPVRSCTASLLAGALSLISSLVSANFIPRICGSKRILLPATGVRLREKSLHQASPSSRSGCSMAVFAISGRTNESVHRGSGTSLDTSMGSLQSNRARSRASSLGLIEDGTAAHQHP